MSVGRLALALALAPLPAVAAEDRVLLEPISTLSVAVVGDLVLSERSLELADGVRVELKAVPTDTGGDPSLRLFRILLPRPLAPVHARTICERDHAVTFLAVAYPPSDPSLPAWQSDEYKMAFYEGKRPPGIAGLRESAAGEGLCLWGAWAEAPQPGD